MNVFQYSANEQAMFSNMLAENGYKTISTFFCDLSIAEFCELYMRDKNAIKSTFKNVCENWLGDYKMFTEFVMALNHKSWEWDERNNSVLCELYCKLFYKAQDLYFKHYKDNNSAIEYYYRITD